MANLASAIMEGAGFGSLSNIDMGNYDYSDSILAESSFINSAMATLYTDVIEAEQSYMVSDVVTAATYLREASNGNNIDGQALLEASVGGAIEKIKNAFKKFIAKVKEYYRKVIDWFKAMFANGEKFVDQFGDKIKEKSRKYGKKFSYEGWKYTFSPGKAAVDKAKKAIEAKIRNQIDNYDFVTDFDKDAFKAKISATLDSKFDEDKVTPASEVVDDFIEKTLKFDDAADMRKELTKAFRDDSDKKVKITNFEGNSVDQMLKFIKDESTTINNLENDLTKYENNVKKVIKQLDKVENWKEDGEGKDTNDARANNASWLSSIVTGLLNTYKIPCEVEIQMTKDAAKDWLGALKKFYNYRPAKESVEVYDAEAYATLENYIILEGEGNGDDDEEVNESYGSDIADILDLASKYRF